MEIFLFHVKADIRNPLRYLLINRIAASQLIR